MPQMSPLNWSFIPMTFLLLMILSSPKMSNSLSNKNYISKNLKIKKFMKW